jgi:hypothetical protein
MSELLGAWASVPSPPATITLLEGQNVFPPSSDLRVPAYVLQNRNFRQRKLHEPKVKVELAGRFRL